MPVRAHLVPAGQPTGQLPGGAQSRDLRRHLHHVDIFVSRHESVTILWGSLCLVDFLDTPWHSLGRKLSTALAPSFTTACDGDINLNVTKIIASHFTHCLSHHKIFAEIRFTVV